METFKEAFTHKYPGYGKILQYFKDSTGVEMTWENITKVRLIKFGNYLQQHIAPSSARQYCAKVRSVLNDYRDEEEADVPEFGKVLSLRNAAITRVYLTDKELEAFCKVKPLSAVEKGVKERFILSAFTGARHSDAIRLDDTNIVDGNIVYISQKTHVESVVPCKPIVREILKHNLEIRNCAESTFNETLRSLCARAGITQIVKCMKGIGESKGEKYKYVTSHTGRRSFATNLYLRGCDIYTISRMLGHTSVEMTANNYICSPIRELSSNVMEYFK